VAAGIPAAEAGAVDTPAAVAAAATIRNPGAVSPR
jgi:hypothetical protein